MILQALTKYYDRLAEQPGTAPEGFKNVEIPFLIIVDSSGHFVGLLDTRTRSGKKLRGRKFVVPQERSRSGQRAWQISNLLWDHHGYVLGWPKSDSQVHRDMARKQHSTFLNEVKRLRERYPSDANIGAVHNFLTKGDFSKIFTHPLWNECAKIPGCNITFMIQGKAELVCQSESVNDFITGDGHAADDDQEGEDGLPEIAGICLITGEHGPIERLHPRTPILGAKSNAKIVSFQKNMGFDSYGKLQSYNAPIGRKAAFAYTTALNDMIDKGSHQKILVGEDTVVFWAERRHEFESVFQSLFGEPPEGEPEQDYKSLISLFRAPYSGAQPDLDPETFFFVLGLAPNAARIAIRFWFSGSVGEIAENVWRHFDDLEMMRSEREWRRTSLRSLLRHIALLGKDENVPPNMAGETVKAILAGTPYPQTLLAAAVRRSRAERNVVYPRAALIKAVLARDSRFGVRFGNKFEEEVSMSLDLANFNVGYRLGRLFALLERVQEEANPGINTTIRERFYGAASASPVTAFPHLMKLKNHHLSKLDNRGRVVNLEKMIGEIVDGLNDFPSHLSLADQGRFAVGYYHQRQTLFTK